MPQRQPKIAQIEQICILLVDDNQQDRAHLISALEEEVDFSWHLCDDADQALKLARELEPDIFILETAPGGTDGLALIEWLHNLPETRHTPVIMLSTQKSIEWKSRAFAMGADDYLVKPVDPQEVALHIRRHVRTSNQFRRLMLSEEALRTRLDIWRTAQEAADIGIWSWNVDSGEIHWSDMLYRIFGFQPRQFEITQERVLEAVHPEDRGRAARTLTRMARQDAPIHATIRIIHPEESDQGIVQIQVLGAAVPQEEGAPRILTGTVQIVPSDLPEEGKPGLPVSGPIRDALQQNIFENIEEGIMITDAKGVIQAINPAFGTIFGYTEDMVVGQTPSMLRSNRHDSAFYNKLWQSLNRDSQWNGEIWNRKKSGEAFPVQVTIKTIRDHRDEALYHLAIYHDLSEIRRSQEALEHQATHDALTGLPNRHLFKDRLGQALHHAGRSGKSVGLLMFDIDLFKKINESLGHAAGDVILQKIADRTRKTIRGVDTLCRLDGNSFATIVDEVGEVHDLLVVVHKLFNALAAPFHFNDQELYITISVGITIYPNDGANVDALIKNAGLALMRAKDTGRNNFQFYTEAMDDHAAERLLLENHLRKALEREEFQLHYQPKRRIRPDGTMVSPGDFIPLAEETGLIQPLGEWILKTACCQTQAWHQAGFDDLQVAVNLSARQLKDDQFVEKVAAILKESGLPPHCLELEITESLMMEDVKRAIRMLEALNSLGIRMSVDDLLLSQLFEAFSDSRPEDRPRLCA